PPAPPPFPYTTLFRSLEKPLPLRLSEWAEQHFYLSPESSYIEGRWECLPYQPAIMDCISNDDIRSVTLMKSARVGYTKIIVAAIDRKSTRLNSSHVKI